MPGVGFGFAELALLRSVEPGPGVDGLAFELLPYHFQEGFCLYGSFGVISGGAQHPASSHDQESPDLGVSRQSDRGGPRRSTLLPGNTETVGPAPTRQYRTDLSYREVAAGEIVRVNVFEPVRPFREAFSKRAVPYQLEPARSQECIESASLVEDVHDGGPPEGRVDHGRIRPGHGVGKGLLNQPDIPLIEGRQTDQPAVEIDELGLETDQDLVFFLEILPSFPPRIDREREQDRADDHHTLRENAEPGNLFTQATSPRLDTVMRDTPTTLG